MSFTATPLPRQDGRTIVVTGANTGLGYHNARDLAALGAHVVMACRTESRAREAMAKIETEVPNARLEFLQLDLGSLAAVRAAAAEFRERHETLDVLINNAGVMWIDHQITEDGFEGHMAANYWGHFLLTMELLDLMPNTWESRVVTLSSIAHAAPPRKIRFDDIHWEREYDKQQAYAQTKLACLLFSLELDRRLKGEVKRIRSVAAHPGVSLTDLARTMNPWLVRAMKYSIGPLISHKPAKASMSTLVAALDESIEGGAYIGPQGPREMKGNPGPAEIHECAQDLDVASRLWDLSLELTGARFPF